MSLRLMLFSRSRCAAALLAVSGALAACQAPPPRFSGGGGGGAGQGDAAAATSCRQQAEDVSYGRLGVAQTLGYLETPTPGTKNSGNQSAGTPTMEEVTFDRTGGLITAAITLNITPPVTAGAVARYTLDNSVPTESSTEWPAGGLPVTGSSQIRVRFMETGKLGGPVSSRSFTLLGPSLTNYRGTGQPFKSNLPILVFNSYGINIDNAGGSPGLRPYRNTYGMSIATDPASGNMASITGPIDMQNRGGTQIHENHEVRMQTGQLGRRAGQAHDRVWDEFPRGTIRCLGQPKENFNAMANPASL